MERANYGKVLRLLSEAIPPDELAALDKRRRVDVRPRNRLYYQENGGNVYSDLMEDDHAAVASWNNTRPSEKEIIEWFERALLLA